MLLMSNLPVFYHWMFSVPNLALENAMACRVYRAVKLGVIKNHQSANYGITVTYPSAPEASSHELAFKQPTLDESHNVNIVVDITQMTDTDMNDGRVSRQEEPLVEEGSDSHGQV